MNRMIKPKKRDTPSLGCTSSLSADTGLTEGTGTHTRDSASYDSNWRIDAQSTTTTTLLELMYDDNNACKCDITDLLGVDDVSLASDHGLMDVKENGYWFDEDSDPGDDNEDTDSSDSADENNASTKIGGDEEEVVGVKSEESDDSLINGFITIDLQPKISTRDQLHSDEEKRLAQSINVQGALIETASTESALKDLTKHADTIETVNESTSESIGEMHFEDRNLELKRSISSEDTNEVIERAQTSLFGSTSDADRSSRLTKADMNKAFKSIDESFNQVDQHNTSTSSESQASFDDRKDATINKSKANSSNHQLLRKQHTGYISPRQQLAHKCLQNALRVIQREDAANASMNSTSMSRAELYSLTNTGCAMMLKKKERETSDEREGQKHECELEFEEEVIEVEDYEQRDDRSTACENGDEERDETIDLADDDNINSGSIVGSPSLVSYIGTVTDSTINNSSSIESNKQSIDPPSSDSQEDSQYLVESDSTAGLSYTGTAVIHDTPRKNLTALNNEDRITDIPQYKASYEKKNHKEQSMDLMQIDTTPTDDETLSLDAAGSQSFGVALTPKASSSFQDSKESETPSEDSVDEQEDTFSPLPKKNTVLSRPCYYSPASSHVTSIAASSASTSVSDVFGLLRTSLNPDRNISENSSGSDEMIPATSSAEESEEMLTTDLMLLKKDISALTSSNGYKNKTKRSKSMTSMHVPDNDGSGLTLGDALMATNIFTPPRTTAQTLGSTPNSVGGTRSKRSNQSELNYGSIGATFSPLRTQQSNRPESVVFGAVTSPTPSMFSGYTDACLSIVKDIETNTRKRASSITTPIKKEMKVLKIAEEMVLDGSDAGSEDLSVIANVLKADRENSDAKNSKRKSSCLQGYLNNEHGSLSADSDPVKLYERVTWLEKILGVNRGGANRAFENEILDLKQKLSVVEQRLDEEMELKCAANKTVQSLQAKLGGLNEEKSLVDKCLRNEVSSLKSQLAFEKIKSETAESDVKAALSSVLDLGLACEKKDEEIAELIKANQQSLKRQAQLESDLVSFAQGNDALRARVVALASVGSTKDNTLSSALAQLKTLSENMYHVQNSLDDEKKGRRDEVEALQYTLDDISRQMLKMSNKMHLMETENDSLRREVKRLKAEKEQTQRMRRSARGF